MCTIHESTSVFDSDEECYESDPTRVIKKLKGPLFKSSEEDLRYAVTVNIQPTRLINKRQWKLYDHDKQRAQLTRMEASIRRKTPSIELLEMHFEVCPVLKNIHMHALYKMPRIFVVELEAQWNRMVGSIINEKTTQPFRHLDIKEVYDEEGWVKYIKKDMLKV